MKDWELIELAARKASSACVHAATAAAFEKFADEIMTLFRDKERRNITPTHNAPPEK